MTPYPSAKSVLSIGNQLLDGPRAILPPATVDAFGWLEPDLRLSFWEAPGLTKVSVALFTDNTANREADFLQPIIRLAHWERGYDIRTKPRWPSITVQLGYFHDEKQLLQASIYRLHQAFGFLPFLPFGISAQREVPSFPYSDDGGNLEMFARNGVQSVTFTTPALPDGDALTAQFREVFAELKNACQPFDMHEWRERYNDDLN